MNLYKELKERHKKYWYWKVATDIIILVLILAIFYIEINTGMQIIEFNDRFEKEGCAAICTNPYTQIDFNISNTSNISYGLRYTTTT